MKNDEPTKVFFYEPHPLMVLGIRALIEKEEDLEFSGSSNSHQRLEDEVANARPAALILDLTLYTEESVKLIEKIRQAFPELKIVLLSTHTGMDYVSRAQKAGANAYVLKTEDPERVIKAIRATLAGQTYVSSEIAEPGERKAHPIDSPINLLSAQQFQILQRVGKGHNNRRISEDLKLPGEKVEEEVSAIQEKLGLSSFVELLQFAFHWVHHEGGFS